MADRWLYFETTLFIYWFSLWRYVLCLFESEEKTTPKLDIPHVPSLNLAFLKEPEETPLAPKQNAMMQCVSPTEIRSPCYDPLELENQSPFKQPLEKSLEEHIDRLESSLDDLYGRLKKSSAQRGKTSEVLVVEDGKETNKKKEKKNQFNFKPLLSVDWVGVFIEDIVHHDEEVQQLKDFFNCHDDELKSIFKRYSIPLEQSLTHNHEQIRVMSSLSFSIFWKTCGLTDNQNLTSRDINEIFAIVVETPQSKMKDSENAIGLHHLKKAALENGGIKHAATHALILPEFIEALIRLAIQKYPLVSPLEAVKSLWTQYISPNAMLDPKDVVRTTLLDPSIQQLFARYAKHIHKLFGRYTKTVGIREAMRLQTFHKFLLHCNIIGNDITRKEATTIFALTQDKKLESEKMLEIDFSEFQECLARIAMLKKDHKKFSNKMKALLKSLSSMSKR